RLSRADAATQGALPPGQVGTLGLLARARPAGGLWLSHGAHSAGVSAGRRPRGCRLLDARRVGQWAAARATRGAAGERHGVSWPRLRRGVSGDESGGVGRGGGGG